MAILRMLHLVLGISAVMRSLVVGVYLLKHLAAPVMLVAPVIIPASSPWWVVPCTCARGILPRRSASTRVLVTKADMVAYTTHPGKDVALLHCAQNCPQLIAVHFVAPVTREIRHVQSCAAVVLLSATVGIALCARSPLRLPCPVPVPTYAARFTLPAILPQGHPLVQPRTAACLHSRTICVCIAPLGSSPVVPRVVHFALPVTMMVFALSASHPQSHGFVRPLLVPRYCHPAQPHSVRCARRTVSLAPPLRAMVVPVLVSMDSAKPALRATLDTAVVTDRRVRMFLVVSHTLDVTSKSSRGSRAPTKAAGNAYLAVVRASHFNIATVGSPPPVPPFVVIRASDVVLFVSVQMVRAAVSCCVENPVVPNTIMLAG